MPRQTIEATAAIAFLSFDLHRKMIIFGQRIEQEPLIGALFFDIEPLTAIKTRKTVLMPVISVLIPVAATPMDRNFQPSF